MEEDSFLLKSLRNKGEKQGRYYHGGSGIRTDA
jgi:hypothetical protein